jgi:hypothetical protein
MARTTPTVWVSCWGTAPRAEVRLPGPPEQGIGLSTPSWQAWLEAPSTFSFAYPIYDGRVGYIRGFMTVRKERRERGSCYWVAYHRAGERVRKIYMGRTAHLTQQQLAVTAERFLAMDVAAVQGEMGAEGQKEVMPGQTGGASLGREAMMRRVKWSHRTVQLGRR